MENCLKRQYKRVVNNDSLDLFGYIKITANSEDNPSVNSRKLRIFHSDTLNIRIGGDGYFITSDPGNGHWSDGTNSAGKTVDYSGVDWADILVSNGNFEISVSGKYQDVFSVVKSPSALSLNIEDFIYIPSGCPQIECINSDSFGDIVKYFKSLPSTVDAAFGDFLNTKVSGSLAGLLSEDVVCGISWLRTHGSNVTDTDAATIAAIEEKFPGIQLYV